MGGKRLYYDIAMRMYILLTNHCHWLKLWEGGGGELNHLKEKLPLPISQHTSQWFTSSRCIAIYLVRSKEMQPCMAYFTL